MCSGEGWGEMCVVWVRAEVCVDRVVDDVWVWNIELRVGGSLLIPWEI
jgi:hypothetical protein